MHSITAFFGLDKLPPEKARALSIVYAASLALMMGITFIQPALPALTQPFQVSDAQLSWIMTLFTAPAIFLSPIFGIIADLHGRRLLLGLRINGVWSVRCGHGVSAELSPGCWYFARFKASASAP